MAINATLKASIREERGKGPARRLRAAGRVPAVVYGHGDATRELSVNAHELERLFAHITVENTLINLEIEDQPAVPVLVREVQAHPFRPELIHVDFYQVHAGERISVEVPIRLVGTPTGVRMGGILDQMLHDLEIRCLPDQIPEAIEVDVAGLAIGESLHVRDLALPPGVAPEIDGERTVCSVVAPTVAALGDTAEAPDGVGGEVLPQLIRKRAQPGELPPATEQGGKG